MCMKTTKFHSYCLESALMFVLKLCRRNKYFFLQTCCLYLLKSFCALCIESLRHFCASLQCVRKRFVASMVCVTSFKPPQCACVLQQDMLEISYTSQSYGIPRTSMKSLWKSTSNLHGRCQVNRILYFNIYRIIHLCFCDFQSINGLDFKVHVCMSTTATQKEL